MRPLPARENIWKGLNHQIQVFSRKDGMPIRSTEPQRPAGMSGRQWKRLKRAARKVKRGAEQMKAAQEKQVAGFFGMGQPKKEIEYVLPHPNASMDDLLG